jgi:polyisoprenoid-binding protein YceI
MASTDTTSPPSASPEGKKPRRWLRFTIAGVIVLVVLVVGGPFVYIHFIEKKAPAKLALTPAPAASAAVAGPIAGDYTVATGSQAGYRVNEVLFGQKTTAVGRTSEVSGSMTISGSTVTATTVTVQMASVASDKAQRDGQFRGRIMDVATYPTSVFKLTSPIDLGSIPTNGVVRTYRTTGTLTLHGVTRPVTVDLSAERANGQVRVSGQIPVKFSDYSVPNPSFAAVTTEDHGIVELLVNFAKKS